jgi:hypothetical protein
MRWTALFEDLESQLFAAEQSGDASEIADRVRREQGGLELADRLRAQLGLILKLGTIGGAVFNGELTHVGSEWVVLSDSAMETVVPMNAVRFVEGMGRHASSGSSRVHQALKLGSALRTLARDRAHVAIHTVDGGAPLEGIIDRVGKDFLELAAVMPGEPRRVARVSAVYAVPFTGIAAVSSRV